MLSPEHKDALEDLDLVNSRLQAQMDGRQEEMDGASGDMADRLFQESNRYFESDPDKAMRILKEVLKLDPQHAEASKDLGILLESRARIER